MNIQNIIFVWADLGATNNFVKNLMLLSPDVHMMNNVSDYNRFNYFEKEIYPEYLKTKLTSWFNHEYKLRKYRTEYGFDFTEDLYRGQPMDEILNDRAKNILQDKKIIFTVHDFEIIKKIKTTHPTMKILYICPNTVIGTMWQIRAYSEKRGYETLHNFMFNENVEENKKEYILKFGLDAYIKENLINMTEIIDSRQQQWKQWALSNDVELVDLEDVLLNNIQYIRHISKQFELNINVDQATSLFTLWQNLHWPFKDTLDWHYKFLENHINIKHNERS